MFGYKRSMLLIGVLAGLLAGCGNQAKNSMPAGTPQAAPGTKAPAGTPAAAGTKAAPGTNAAAAAPQLMFVQTAEDLKVDAAAKTFRLVNVNQRTLFFSDRPERIAGHFMMADYLKTWSQGKDNFGDDPPNATLSVYEPGRADQTLAVVKITNPVVNGNDLVYTYQLISGTMPAKGGATALFIDWFAAGRGRVGVVGGFGGYRPMGVGYGGIRYY